MATNRVRVWPGVGPLYGGQTQSPPNLLNEFYKAQGLNTQSTLWPASLIMDDPMMTNIDRMNAEYRVQIQKFEEDMKKFNINNY